MKQLTIGDILTLVSDLKITTDMTDKEIDDLPIYIGDDDELNGIHTAWDCEFISDDEIIEEFIELVNMNCTNIEFSGKAVLIS